MQYVHVKTADLIHRGWSRTPAFTVKGLNLVNVLFFFVVNEKFTALDIVGRGKTH